MSRFPTADIRVVGSQIITTRMLAAPRAKVLQAWSNPDHIGAWWGPDGFMTTTQEFALVSGGCWRFIMHGPDGRDYPNKIIFEEVELPLRLVYRHTGDDGAEPVRFSVEVLFEERGDATLFTMRASFPTVEMHEHVEREYHAIAGAQQNADHMAAYAEAL